MSEERRCEDCGVVATTVVLRSTGQDLCPSCWNETMREFAQQAEWDEPWCPHCRMEAFSVAGDEASTPVHHEQCPSTRYMNRLYDPTDTHSDIECVAYSRAHDRWSRMVLERIKHVGNR